MNTTSFTYLDQFKDINITLLPYIKSIKDNNNFDYTFSNNQPIQTTIKNLFDRIDVVSTYKNSISFFDYHIITDDEDLFILANNYYSNTDLWWLICIFNNIHNVFTDWPMSETQLQDVANKLYTNENKFNYKTYYDLISNRNEDKRKIILLRPAYINDVIVSFIKVYNS